LKIKNIIFVVIFSSLIFGQSAEKSGLAFLKIGYGARNIALGDVGFVIADGATAGFYNPALLQINSYQASFTHSSYMQDVKSEMFGASFTLFNLPFAAGINTTSVSNIEIRTRPGEAEGTFNAHYFYGSLSTAFCLIENLKVGVTGKYLFENFYSDQATGWGLDLGLLYKTSIENLNIAAAMNNLGTMNELRNEKTVLPTSAALGLSYNTTLGESFLLTAAAGYKRFLKAESNHIHSGLEVVYDNTIAARVGYLSGFETKDFSYGVGLNWGSFNFDYAFVPNDYGLGNSSYLTIICTF
jgi:hypothetical protein